MKTPAKKGTGKPSPGTFSSYDRPGGDSAPRFSSLEAPGEPAGMSILEQCITEVREAIGVNRLAIFLADHPYSSPNYFLSSESRLACVGAIGIPAAMRENLELTKDAGIGKWVTRHGKILRQKDAAAILTSTENSDVQREFESLNCQSAVPITDQRNTIGVALLGPPVTRSEFSEEELQVIFHLMEKLGLLIKKDRDDIRVHFENKLLNQMFCMLHCGALVVARDLKIPKANSAIKELLGIDSGTPLSFDEIPAVLAEQIRGALEQGEVSGPFFLSLPEDPQKRLLRITLSPLLEEPNQSFHLVMVIVEDYSEVEAAKQAAIKTAAAHIIDQLQLLTEP